MKKDSSPDTAKRSKASATLEIGFFYGPIIHSLLIVILGFIVYSNTFYVPFQFDDAPNIKDNPIIKDLKYFTEPSSAKAFPMYDALKSRFVGYLTFALNYKLHGLDVSGYHIVNLAIHLINALLVYWLVILTFQTPKIKQSLDRYALPANLIAFFSALLFVSHPIETQAVTYIVQRLASLATMFYLLSITNYIKSRLSGEKARQYILYGISLVSAILAMKTKEIALTLPVMIVIYEFMFLEGKLTKRIIYLIPLVMTMAIIPFTLLSMDKPIGSLISDVSEATRIQTTMTRMEYLFTQFRVIATYIRLLFFPINQNLDYDYPVYHSFFDRNVLLPFLLLASILALGIYIFYRFRNTEPYTRLISLGIFWFFLALSVESSVIPIVDVIFEHRMYLPSVGAFIAITTVLFILIRRLKQNYLKTAVAIFGLIVIALSGVSYARNIVWQSEIALWNDVAEKSPNKARGHGNLGYVYASRDLFDMAIEQYQMALNLKSDLAETHNNLGIAYNSKGLHDVAIEQYRIALALKPDYAEPHFNLGVLYLNTGRTDMARREFELGLIINPDDYRAQQILKQIESK